MYGSEPAARTPTVTRPRGAGLPVDLSVRVRIMTAIVLLVIASFAVGVVNSAQISTMRTNEKTVFTGSAVPLTTTYPVPRNVRSVRARAVQDGWAGESTPQRAASDVLGFDAELAGATAAYPPHLSHPSLSREKVAPQLSQMLDEVRAEGDVQWRAGRSRTHSVDRAAAAQTFQGVRVAPTAASGPARLSARVSTTVGRFFPC